MAKSDIRVVLGREKGFKSVMSWLQERGQEADFFLWRYGIPSERACMVFRSLPVKMEDQTGKLEPFFNGQDLLPVLQGSHASPNVSIDGPFWTHDRVGDTLEGGGARRFCAAYTQLFRHGGIEAAVVFDRQSEGETILPASWFDENWERNEQHSIRFNMKRLLEKQADFGLETNSFIQFHIFSPHGMNVYLRDGDDHGKLDRNVISAPPIAMGPGADIGVVAKLLTDFIWNAFGRVGPSMQQK